MASSCLPMALWSRARPPPRTPMPHPRSRRPRRNAGHLLPADVTGPRRRSGHAGTADAHIDRRVTLERTRRRAQRRQREDAAHFPRWAPVVSTVRGRVS